MKPHRLIGDLDPRQHRQESESDQGFGFQTAGGEIRIRKRNNLIKAFDLLMQLTADTTDKKIFVRWEFAEKDLLGGS